jgi:molybdenum cofactor cytidylyltransferase
MSYTLPQAFGLTQTNSPQMVAFTGAGGKTSLMFALAGTLPGKIVITTTTRMAREQIQFAAESIPAAVSRWPGISCIACTRISAIVGPDVEPDKVGGVSLDVPGRLLAQPDVAFVLVEADGARMLPLKAPASHEPALPPQTDPVVPVSGIDALGKTIAAVAHRPELVAALLGKSVDDAVEALDLATIAAHPQGGLKNVPPAARVIPVINKVENDGQLKEARSAARAMLGEPRIQQVVIAAAERPHPVVEVQKRITAVILAAGGSSRMGHPKLLLPWGKTTVLGRTIGNVQDSAVFDSLVVTGAQVEGVAGIAHGAGLPTLFNERYATGEMLSSLQTAVHQLPPQIEAVLVMLGDQPLVEPQIIDLILTAFWQGKGEIIAPQYGSRRGNPVLIGRRYFEELLALPPGAAPRDLLKKHAAHLVPVDSESVLLDIDDPAEYERLRPR